MTQLTATDHKQHLKYAFGSTIKMLDDTRFGGYLINFTDTDNRDLDNEYFSKATDIATPHSIAGMPLLFHHGLDPRIKDVPIGTFTKGQVDEHGLWVEGILRERAEYEKFVNEWYKDKQAPLSVEDYDKAISFIKGLIRSERIGFSSGANANTADIDRSGHIKKWAVFEGSATHTPADPLRTQIYSLKSILDISHDIDPIEPTEVKEGENPRDMSDGLRGDDTHIENKSIDKDSPTMAEQATVVKMTDDEMEKIVKEVMSRVQSKMDGNLDDDEMDKMADQMKTEAKSFTFDAETATEEVYKQAQIKLFESLPTMLADVQAKKAEIDAELNEAFNKSMSTVMGKSKVGSGSHQKNTAPRYDMRTEFDHWTAEDFSFAADVDRLLRAKGEQLPIQMDEKFYREYADKATKAYDKREIDLDSLTLKSARSIKSDELMYSTQAGYGDEHVPTAWRQQIWRRVRRENVVAPQVQMVEMPSNPYILPVESTDPVVYNVPEANDQTEMNLGTTIFPDSKIGTTNVTLTAGKLGLQVFISAELQEDGVAGAIPMYRAQADRVMQDSIDNVILNGHTATSNNLNFDGDSAPATAKYTIFNGLMTNAIVTNSSNAVNGLGTSPTLDSIRNVRYKLDRSKSRVQDLVIFTHPEVEHKLLNMNEFLTMDKAGSRATAQTGQIGFIDGIPVLITNEIATSDTDGKITYNGNSVERGRLVIASKPSWYVGYRRNITTTLSFLPHRDSWVLTSTVRLAFVGQDGDSVSVLYNIGI